MLILLSIPTWAQQCDKLKAVDWLLGEWEATRGDSRITETWLPVSGATYEGAGKTLIQGQLKSEESLRIVDMSGALYLIAKVKHNALPVVFSLTSCTATSARFENLAHDFPKRVEYTRESESRLTAHVSDAESKGFTINFTRKTDAPH